MKVSDFDGKSKMVGKGVPGFQCGKAYQESGNLRNR
jgi:hypothetical protein